MKKDEFKDDLLENLIPQVRTKMPFTDFEDKVMRQVHQEAKHRASVFKDLKISFVFFILGTVFGVVFTLLLPKLDWTFYKISTQDLVLPIFFILTIIFIICFENFVRLLKEYKN